MKTTLYIFIAVFGLLVVSVIYRRRALTRAFALTPESRLRIKPRLITEAAADRIGHRIGPLPLRDFFGLPLKVAYVLDSPRHVAYLSESMMRKLDLDPASLHTLALANLGKETPSQMGSAVFAKKTTVMLKSMDGFDAARLILLPSLLKEGEELAVVIPDKDTLGLLPVPADWTALTKLAESHVSEPLYPKPLRVNHRGVFAVG